MNEASPGKETSPRLAVAVGPQLSDTKNPSRRVAGLPSARPYASVPSMVGTATPTRAPFADASPAEIREAVLPEEQPQLDRHYRRVLHVAAETLRLDELEEFLVHWRRIAWAHTAHGHDSWRVLLAKADRVLDTGELPPGTVSADEIRELLRERRAQT